jgi:hypothetical protein
MMKRKERSIKIEVCPTVNMIGDNMTKPLQVIGSGADVHKAKEDQHKTEKLSNVINCTS